MEGLRNIRNILEPVFPCLLDRVRRIIEDTEREYVSKKKEEKDSFLWEHTVHVASIARNICLLEKEDPLLPVIGALFHDMGKFSQGRYHEKSIPEEHISAEMAENILAEEGLDESDIRHIVSGLVALYDEITEKNRITDIIHDADFLSKSGYLGVAQFFTKSALKGQNLFMSLSQSLSKELTYASVLPENMRTRAGRMMAEQKSRDSLTFYLGLVRDLSDSAIARFNIKEEELPCPQKKGSVLKIVLAIPEACPECGDNLSPKFSFSQGIKCTELIAAISCAGCPVGYTVTFCLPEILC
ncbi:MAG: HD domain-containing protein [Candidatus Aminicenantes bacterium]|jgi:putative nucleotidyltransferase with HDIG domain